MTTGQAGQDAFDVSHPGLLASCRLGDAALGERSGGRAGNRPVGLGNENVLRSSQFSHPASLGRAAVRTLLNFDMMLFKLDLSAFNVAPVP